LRGGLPSPGFFFFFFFELRADVFTGNQLEKGIEQDSHESAEGNRESRTRAH